MNKPAKILFAALATIFLAVSPMRAAAVDAPPVNPANQPLVVFRAATGDTVQSVLDTRQAKALRLGERDFSGPIPGVGAHIDSARSFLAALAIGDAKNLWYCLTQQGASLANQTAALGWDAKDDASAASAARVTEWLKAMGLDASRQDVTTEPLDSSHARIIISRDADARQEILGGTIRLDQNPAAKARDDRLWRENLSGFLASKNGGLGVWANTRPLLGLLTVLTGIDFRSKMNAHNMSTPVSAQVELYNNKGDLGFDARINNLLPDEWVKTESNPLLIQTRPDAIMDVNFPAPAGLWDVLDIDKEVFFLANINILPLIPRSINVATWRENAGAMHWSAIGLMGNKDKFREQLKRLHGWAELIAALSGATFKLEDAQSAWGDSLWRMTVGADSFVAGVVDVEAAGRDNAFLVLADSAESWPNPMELKVAPAESDTLVHWRVNLDEQSKRELVEGLSAMSQERGARDFDAAFFDEFLPDTDTGWVSMEGRSLRAISTHGLMPLLVPGIMEAAKKAVQPGDAGLQKVAALQN